MTDIVTDPTPPALYMLWHRCWDTCQDPGDPYGRSPDHVCWEVHEYPITKVTATRIYFRERRGGRNYFLQRDAFDAEGRAYHRRVLGGALHLTPPEVPSRAKPVSLADLRRAMADAHPDRGGDRDTFMAARGRYEAAKRRAS